MAKLFGLGTPQHTPQYILPLCWYCYPPKGHIHVDLASGGFITFTSMVRKTLTLETKEDLKNGVNPDDCCLEAFCQATVHQPLGHHLKLLRINIILVYVVCDLCISLPHIPPKKECSFLQWLGAGLGQECGTI